MPRLVDYSLVYLDRSWIWLNDPEIKALTLTPDFTREDQLAFFHSLPNKKNYWIKGLQEDDHPIGAMGLKNIDGDSAEYWGYIGEKAYWGKGIGSFMLQQAIDKARSLELRQLYLKVDEQNARAKQLYMKMGFQLNVPGTLEKYHLNL